MMRIVFTQYNASPLLNKLLLLINLLRFNFVNRGRLPSCPFGIILAIFLCDSVTRWFFDDTTTCGHSSVRIWSWLIWQWLHNCDCFFLGWCCSGLDLMVSLFQWSCVSLVHSIFPVSVSTMHILGLFICTSYRDAMLANLTLRCMGAPKSLKCLGSLGVLIWICMERYQQQSLRRILSIQRQIYVRDVDILERNQPPSTESLVLQHRFQMNGQRVRMKDDRIPKQFLFCELTDGKRPAHILKLK